VQSIERDLEAAVATSGHASVRKLLRAVEEFHTHIENNGGFMPNYGERYRQGERIGTGFVKSTVNQVISKRFCKRQQMQWTPRGAHLLLQIRTRVLNGIPRVVSGVPYCSPGNGGVPPRIKRSRRPLIRCVALTIVVKADQIPYLLILQGLSDRPSD
jgi:hypothetical protein